MKVGEYIRKLRKGGNPYGKKISQEELGQLLDPPINRAAIHKWEHGHVTTIKRPYVLQLAEIFGVDPNELMCFSSEYNEKEIAEEVKVIEQVQQVFGTDAVNLLKYFNDLNEIGKKKALNDLIDLSEHPRYSDDGSR